MSDPEEKTLPVPVYSTSLGKLQKPKAIYIPGSKEEVIPDERILAPVPKNLQVTYDVYQVADVFITLSQQENLPLSSSKLEALVYLAQGIHIGSQKHVLIPLFSNKIKAWANGPGISEFHLSLEPRGNLPIDTLFNTGQQVTRHSPHFESIKSVWRRFKNTDEEEIQRIIKAPCGAWHIAFAQKEFVEITPDELYESFSEELLELHIPLEYTD